MFWPVCSPSPCGESANGSNAASHDPGAGIAETPWTSETAWRVEEVLLLGRLDGTQPDVFGEIRAIDVTPQGELLVFDHFGNELRRFDASGNHLGSVGGTGAGPNEFRSVVAISARPNGEVWIIDALNARYTVVDAQGQMRTFPRVAGRVVRRTAWVGGFDDDGRMTDIVVESRGNAVVDAMIRLGDDGSVVSEHPIPRIEVPAPTLGFGVMVSLPFLPRVMRAWDRRGAVWQALDTEYRLTRLDMSGDTTMVVTRDRQQPLTTAEQDSLNDAIVKIEADMGIKVADDVRPDRVPLLRWFTVDTDGHLWVCATGRDPCTTADVHSPEGTFLGAVELPVPIASAPAPLVRDGRIYGVTSGAHGEPQLFVGRVHRP